MNNRTLLDVINLDIDLFDGKSLVEISSLFNSLFLEHIQLYKNEGENVEIIFRDISGGYMNFSVTCDMTEEDIEYQRRLDEFRAKEIKKDDMKELKKILKKYDMEVKEWK